jgi:putative N6-adenine-specific DNA methylase
MLVNPPYGERIDVAGVAGIPALQGRDQRRSQFQGQNIDEFGQPVARDESPQVSRDRSNNPGREQAQTETGEQASEFFPQLSAHWKKNYAGWTAHVLTPDLKLPGKMRLKESRRVPMWNGPIECRLFRFDMVAGSARNKPAA